MFGIFKKETVYLSVKVEGASGNFIPNRDVLIVKEQGEMDKYWTDLVKPVQAFVFTPEELKELLEEYTIFDYIQAKMLQVQIKLSIHYMNNTNDADTLYFIGKQVKELEQQLKDLENEK